jgi:hypothetical protein
MDMTTHDEELQHKLLSGLADDSIDGYSYKRIFYVLSKEPNFELPINFADTVLKQIETKEQKSTAREMGWLAAGIFVLLVGAIVGALKSGFKPSFGAYKFWASYPGLLVFGVTLILLIHWLDRKIVKPRPTL